MLPRLSWMGGGGGGELAMKFGGDGANLFCIFANLILQWRGKVTAGTCNGGRGEALEGAMALGSIPAGCHAIRTNGCSFTESLLTIKK